MSEQAAVESIGKEEVNQGSKWWKWLIGGSLLASSPLLVMLLLLFGFMFMFLMIFGTMTEEGETKIIGGEISQIGENEIPAEYLPVYKAAEEKYGVPWNLLAAHHRVETRFSTLETMVSSVGAIGHLQFMVLTWIGWSYPGGDRLGNADRIDFACSIGQSVPASKDGKVVYAGWQNPNNHKEGYGLYVWVDHGNGSKTTYAHLSGLSVSLGCGNG
ncbi:MULTISPECIES: M23 family metallopeptidase [unclassified Peribacillus]|uniref:M23 family metallopeptidase n=1 Tax=unclassified Peribacillus TaxID=2675266 RepID=UPI00366ED7AA